MRQKSASVVFMVLLVLASLHQVLSHGRLMDPPARNSMWRFGFPNPINYNDNELYCGGKMVQWVRNKGKCGVCGDPWHGVRHHEMGGRYANGIISRSYREGDNIKVAVHLTANHLGWFEFRICPMDDSETEVTQKCLDQHLLYSSDGHDSRFHVAKGKNSVFFNFTVKLPVGLVCEQCVFQWKYRTGNTWDKDDKSGIFCLGCGPQEEFYNCADITIEPVLGQNDYSSSKSRSEVNTKTVGRKESNEDKISPETPPILTTTLTTLINQRTENENSRKVNLFDWFDKLSLKEEKNRYLMNKNIKQKTDNKIKQFFQITSQTMQPTLVPPMVKPIPKLTNISLHSKRISQRNPNLKQIIKSRADTSVESIYSTKRKMIDATTTVSRPTRKRITLANTKSKGRKPSPKVNIEKNGISQKMSSKKFSNPFSTGQNWLSSRNHKITTHGSETRTPTTPKVLLTSKPCHKTKTMRKQVNKMSQAISSPVGRFDLGWWGEHYFRAPAISRISSTWPVKPVLKCRAIILLSGGMDDWCFVNCNANYCPSNLCQCRRELSYSPLFMSSNDHVVSQGLPSSHVEDIQQSYIPQPVRLPLNNNNQIPSLTSQTNVALTQHNSQHSTVENRCKAIGVHAGNSHFDQWCNRNCFSFWCPSSLCLCR